MLLKDLFEKDNFEKKNNTTADNRKAWKFNNYPACKELKLVNICESDKFNPFIPMKFSIEFDSITSDWSIVYRLIEESHIIISKNIYYKIDFVLKTVQTLMKYCLVGYLVWVRFRLGVSSLIMVNPLKPNGISLFYHFDQSISRIGLIHK